MKSLRSQAFIGMEISLALCLLFAVLLLGAYTKFYMHAGAPLNRIASDINSTSKLISGFMKQPH